jgi:hypothetical protein
VGKREVTHREEPPASAVGGLAEAAVADLAEAAVVTAASVAGIIGSRSFIVDRVRS